jgi:hypothetical protein
MDARQRQAHQHLTETDTSGCGLTTLERSDRRRLAYPEMAVSEGESQATLACPDKMADEVGFFQCTAS